MDLTEVMSPDLEKLLDGSGWVRNLARSLIADPHAADDLVQEAWIVALERHPTVTDEGGLRRWMAAVVRNLARDRQRGDGRRRAHEGNLARDAALGDTHQDDAAETLERLDTHRKLVGAIRSLDEPYRTTIRLRYLEGKSPSEIARRLGVPVRSVHSRLNRALSKLRAQLNRDFEEGNGTWLLALLPLSRGGSGWTVGTFSGALIMSAKLKLVIVALTLVGVAAIATYSGEGVEPPQALAADSRTEMEPIPVSEFDGPERQAVSIEPVRVSAASKAGKKKVVAMGAVRGRVLHVDGTPASGVRVGIRVNQERARGFKLRIGSGPTARTDASGRFTLETSRADEFGGLKMAELVILDPRYSTVLQPGTRFRQQTATEQVLVIAIRQPLTGTVVDRVGNPLSGASVTADVGHEIRSRFSQVLEHARVPHWSATSDANGRFEIPEAPRLENGKLVTVCPGFAKDFRALPESPTSNLEIVLGAVGNGLTQLDGTVVDAAGQPVAGARVALEFSNGTTDADGRFSLRLFGDGERGVLMAIKPGALPARLERSGTSDLAPGAWPDPLVLTLGGTPLSIRARVVDSAGNPIENAQVWTADVTHFGAIESDAGPMITVAADVESLLSLAEDGERRVWTDADGAFELAGLLDKAYRISVHDTKNIRFMRSEPVRAGTDGLIIEMPEEERIPQVAGRVVNTAGEPVASVSVSLCRILSTTPGFKNHIRTHPVTTDKKGEFTLHDVPRSMTHADVSGPGLDFMDNRRPLPEGADFENLELVALRSCRARIELGDPEKASSFGLLNADGEESMVTIFGGDFASSSPRGHLLDGRSQIFSASEDAHTLVLFKDTEEIERIPLHLQPDELTELQL